VRGDLPPCLRGRIHPSLGDAGRRCGRPLPMGAVAVTGSAYIPIVVPIMAFLAMFGWLGLVFYADSHPGWKPRNNSARAATTEAHGSSEASSKDRAVGPASAGAPGLAPAARPTDPDRGLTAGEAPVGAGRGIS
jgi:hypothetical protein